MSPRGLFILVDQSNVTRRNLMRILDTCYATTPGTAKPVPAFVVFSIGVFPTGGGTG